MQTRSLDHVVPRVELARRLRALDALAAGKLRPSFTGLGRTGKHRKPA